MSITLDYVSCFWHLPIRGRLLDHLRINRVDALDMIVKYLGVTLKDALKEINIANDVMLDLNSPLEGISRLIPLECISSIQYMMLYAFSRVTFTLRRVPWIKLPSTLDG